MSVKWTCDYPECGAASVKNEDWHRYDELVTADYFLWAIPFMGILYSLLVATLGSGPNYTRHYCPEHSKFLAGK